MKRMVRFRAAILAASLAGALLTLPRVSHASGPGVTAQPQQDDSVTGAAASRLDKKQFKDVKATVENGIATLTGTVDLYEYKNDAQKRVLHAKGVTAVRNEIQVAGASIPDQALNSKLSEKLTYDPDAYGKVFDAITLNVSNGVVALGGHAHNYVDRDSAVALVSTTPGVKDVVDNIEVDPASQMDDRIRMDVARAVYGFPSLNRYAIDPAKPIRIAVQNGNVELYGVVDSAADKNVANIQANSVPGVFSVKNYIEVASQPAESQK
ncbi:MAG: BON domain-containing protein [Terracidiphilus sp.]|jgi:hyperosmotically inducible protein